MSEDLQASLEFQSINEKEIASFTESFKNSLINAMNPKIFMVNWSPKFAH